MFSSIEVWKIKLAAWVSGSRFEQKKERDHVVLFIGKPGDPVQWPFDVDEVKEFQAKKRSDLSFWDPTNNQERSWIEILSDNRVVITKFQGKVPVDILRKETFGV
ncbi:hypothetical protein HY085_01425 [Candidatus Gottesmanbacteria bacterium]|nr:hypothetical protein [Candidatus Gottesmanbacteria bacterium]